MILILARYLLLLILGIGLSSVISLAANENGPYADDGKKAWQQEIEVSGTVADAQTDEPLPGVNIVVEGTTVGTSTDMDGNYTIEAPADATLVFS
ncbi:MAG: carboxypeptidase-like regulatory domain-containing protein, partial [Bacteroidota bacterium]